MSPTMGHESLTILCFTPDRTVLEVCERALGTQGDRVWAAGSAEAFSTALEGLGKPLRVDLAFLDVVAAQHVGLALLHQLHTLSPGVELIALTTPDAAELSAQALALGARGILLMPPAGDELLTALAAVRTRRAQTLALVREQARSAWLELVQSALARLAQVTLAQGSQVEAGSLWPTALATLTDTLGLAGAALFAGHESLVRRVGVGSLAPGAQRSLATEVTVAPTSESAEHTLLRSEYDGAASLTQAMSERAGRCVRIDVGSQEPSTWVALDGWPQAEDDGLDALGAQLSLCACLQRRAQGAAHAMKDPSSSAYSLAFFADLAGREIDRARRWRRRFSLAILLLQAPPRRMVDFIDWVLKNLRDTDVVARMQEDELAVLLTDADGVGAHRFFRRVAQARRGSGFEGAAPSWHEGISVGVATFPHDGTQLARLLHVAHERAELSSRSLVHRLKLQELSLSELLDALAWAPVPPHGEPPPVDSPRVLELPLVDAIALARGMTQHASVGGRVSLVVSELLGRELEGTLMTLPKESVQVRQAPPPGETSDLEALVVTAEHASYALLGRVSQGIFRGVHASDASFADLVAERLGHP